MWGQGGGSGGGDVSEWIESHTALREHPKLKRLARLLGINRRDATGLLHWLWWWAMDYAPDGDLSAYTEADIADGLDWDGDAKKLIAALREAGFIDKKELKLHDWEDYGGRLYRWRAANAKRMKEARAPHSDNTCATRAQHVRNTSEATGQDSTGQDSTGQTVQDRTNIEEAAALTDARARDADLVVTAGSSSNSETPETSDDPILWELWELPGWKKSRAEDAKKLAWLRATYPAANAGTLIAQVKAKAEAGTLKSTPWEAVIAFAKWEQEKADALGARERPAPKRVEAPAALSPDVDAAQIAEQAGFATRAREQSERMAVEARRQKAAAGAGAAP